MFTPKTFVSLLGKFELVGPSELNSPKNVNVGFFLNTHGVNKILEQQQALCKQNFQDNLRLRRSWVVVRDIASYDKNHRKTRLGYFSAS